MGWAKYEEDNRELAEDRVYMWEAYRKAPTNNEYRQSRYSSRCGNDSWWNLSDSYTYSTTR